MKTARALHHRLVRLSMHRLHPTACRLGSAPKVPSSRRWPRIFLTSGLDYVENNNIIMI